MSRKEINILRKIVHQAGFIYKIIQGCTVSKTLNMIRILNTGTLGLELRKKLVKCYIWNIALYGAETWTLRAVDQKHTESFEMWCWRRMEKFSWTDRVRNEEVLLKSQ
jgi:hypothetical protein